MDAIFPELDYRCSRRSEPSEYGCYTLIRTRNTLARLLQREASSASTKPLFAYPFIRPE